MMPVVPGGLPSVPRLTVMPPSSASSGTAPTPVALVPNIAAGNNSITIQVKSPEIHTMEFSDLLYSV